MKKNGKNVSGARGVMAGTRPMSRTARGHGQRQLAIVVAIAAAGWAAPAAAQWQVVGTFADSTQSGATANGSTLTIDASSIAASGGTGTAVWVNPAGNAPLLGPVYGGAYLAPPGLPGFDPNAGPADGNKVTITDRPIGLQDSQGNSVAGGFSAGGNGMPGLPGMPSSNSNGGNGGSASENSVLIQGTSPIGGSVVGGASMAGNGGDGAIGMPGANGQNGGDGGNGGAASGNTVTITGVSVLVGGSVVGGMSLGGTGGNGGPGGPGTASAPGGTGGAGGNQGTGGAASNNQVTVTDAAVGGVIFGGLSSGPAGTAEGGDASGNQVKVTNAVLQYGAVTGGSGATASNNSVTLTGGTGANAVTGGEAGAGDAAGNQVTATGGVSTSFGSLTGGVASGTSGNASGNKVTLSGGAAALNVIGGRSANGDATSNAVEITGSAASGPAGMNVAGGVAGFNGIGVASGNTVTVSNSQQVMGTLAGGVGSIANDNTVSLSASQAYTVYGGLGDSGLANGNSVTLTGSQAQAVLGGQSNVDASGNSVVLSGSEAPWVMGGMSAGKASGNSVAITDGAVGADDGSGPAGLGYGLGSGTVAGGMATLSGAQGSAQNNAVTMGGAAQINGIAAGGWAELGPNQSADVSGNQVTVDDGARVKGLMIGGGGMLTNGGSVNASGNVLSIGGNAEVSGLAAGGGAILIGNGGSAAANGNRVVISGSPNLSGAYLAGGVADAFDTHGVLTPMPVAGTGNVLEVHSSGLSAINTYGFQRYDFLLPASIAPDSVVLDLSGAIPQGFPVTTSGVGVDTDLTGAQVGVALQSGGAPVLKTGDRVTLIHNANGVKTDPTVAQASMTDYQGIALQYEFGLSADPYDLYATLNNIAVQQQSEAPSQGRLGSLTQLRDGAELIGAGIGDALRVTGASANRTEAFGAISGGSSRYDTGSHINVDGTNLLLGVAHRYDSAHGATTAGVFFEGGYGHHGTVANGNAGQEIDGSGNSHYWGGGVLGRHDWALTHGNGVYAEGSLHLGRVTTNWSSGNMTNSNGSAAYDVSSTYYGTYLGAGYLHTLNAANALDFSAKYFWTHVDGADVTISGDPFALQSMNSNLTRLGVRLNHTLKDNLVGYVGAAWEHEFSGRARATVYGLDAPTPSLAGNTGVIEAGLKLTPDAKGRFSADVGLQGYFGERKGVSGIVKFRYRF